MESKWRASGEQVESKWRASGEQVESKLIIEKKLNA
jgi:hypothetical protein